MFTQQSFLLLSKKHRFIFRLNVRLNWQNFGIILLLAVFGIFFPQKWIFLDKFDTLIASKLTILAGSCILTLNLLRCFMIFNFLVIQFFTFLLLFFLFTYFRIFCHIFNCNFLKFFVWIQALLYIWLLRLFWAFISFFGNYWSQRRLRRYLITFFTNLDIFCFELIVHILIILNATLHIASRLLVIFKTCVRVNPTALYCHSNIVVVLTKFGTLESSQLNLVTVLVFCRQPLTFHIR